LVAQEPYNRIKKEMLKEIKGMGPGERVLIVGNSREPWLCAKKDEKAFMSFWGRMLFMPLPDYASRKVRYDPSQKLCPTQIKKY
jgi:IQ and AAA domain-containing protein